ncbi:MAG: hypothetical protein OXF11_21520 [Deltaproteobacteria bacterium]|nr:hypothetical protein [Deltaproteobacteria bacterium]
MEYLVHDAGADGHVRRFGEKPPIVLVAEGATQEMVQDTIWAVQAINASLPDTWQLRFASEPAVANAVRPRNGEIVVEFQPREQWPVDPPPEPDAEGLSQRFETRDRSEILSGHVWIDAGWWRANGIHQPQPRRARIVHQLLQTLGRNPVDGTLFPNTVMKNPPDRVPWHVLHRLDREALLAVYGWLEPGTRTETIFEELGAWSEESVHLVGKLVIPSGDPPCVDYSDCASLLPPIRIDFGVAARNGLVQPWVTGLHSPDLRKDPWSSDRVLTWSGYLLGFTPANRSVAGAARLTVDTESLDGELELSDLESWTAKPGAFYTGVRFGTGNPWGDGNLEYTITVRGNTFVQTGGDEGVVTGVFMGPYHNGMGGVLKREDLTAAFAGERPYTLLDSLPPCPPLCPFRANEPSRLSYPESQRAQLSVVPVATPAGP